MDEGDKTGSKGTQGPSSNSSAKGGSGDEGGLGDTYFSHSKQYHHEPRNHDTPSHHAPIPPSPNLAPFESTLEPPEDLSPSPAFRIVTSTPLCP